MMTDSSLCRERKRCDEEISVKPKNFEGKEDYFSAGFMVEEKTTLQYSCSVSDFRLWWPNGYGEQPLYQIEISVCAENDLIQHFTETLGIRQIEMRPAAEPRTEEEKAWRNAALWSLLSDP